MSRNVKAGTVDVSVTIRILDATTGAPKTDVVFSSPGIAMEYRREGAVSVGITEVTLAALTTAHTDGGFLHVGNGYYRLDTPDAACAVGSTGVLVHGAVTGGVVIGEYLDLVAYDQYAVAGLGLTNLDAAVSTRLATAGYTAPPSVTQVRTEMDTNSTKLDVAVGTRLATAGYTAPPTVVQTRQEMDANSTKLDVAVGTRLSTAGYTVPPTAAAVRAEIDANSTKLDVTVGSRLATVGYTAPDNTGIGVAASAAAAAATRVLLALPAIAPGGAGGVLISGANVGTTTFGAMVISGSMSYGGAVSYANGIAISQATPNAHGIIVTGNGTAEGIHCQGGASGTGMYIGGNVSGSGLIVQGGASGNGVAISAGAYGLVVNADGACGIRILAPNGVGLHINSGFTIDGAFIATNVNNNIVGVAGTTAPTAAAIRAEIDANSVIRKLLQNKKVISTASGIMTVHDDDGSPLLSAPCYMDSSGTVLYDGSAGINNTARLV